MAAYVDVMDITMMFSVADIIGLNAFLRKVLANAAGAAHGMAQVEASLATERRGQTLIGMSNLGVLTSGALLALERFAAGGYEVIVFHAVGSGGRAMERMMRQGIIGAVFDYAMGEITDELFGGVRAGGQERLTVAGELGLPQVLCPGGAEHVGVLVSPPSSVPEKYKNHQHVFHNPVIFVPRLQAAEMVEVARDIARRLEHTRGNAVLMLPLAGTGSYAKPGGRSRPGERRGLLCGAEGPRAAPWPWSSATPTPRTLTSSARLSTGCRPHRAEVTCPAPAPWPRRFRNARRRLDHTFVEGRPGREDLAVILHGVTGQRDRPWAKDLEGGAEGQRDRGRAVLVRGKRRLRRTLRGRHADEGSGGPREHPGRVRGLRWPASATAWAARSDFCGRAAIRASPCWSPRRHVSRASSSCSAISGIFAPATPCLESPPVRGTATSRKTPAGLAH